MCVDETEYVSDLDLFCEEDIGRDCPTKYCDVLKEDTRWSLATYHLRREIGVDSSRERLWVHTANAVSPTAKAYKKAIKSKIEDSSLRLYLAELLAVKMPSDNRGDTLWLKWHYAEKEMSGQK